MKSIDQVGYQKRTVSIVVATYNGARYLETQLNSLLAQEHAPDEIVISDDNSTDDTLKIIEDFANRSHVPVLINRNVPGLGFANNFLNAAYKAHGDIIAFCDQDDVWHPSKLSTCLPFFDDQSVSMVTHRANLINSKGEIVGEFDQGIKKYNKLSPLSFDLWSVFFGFSILFRKDILRVSGNIERFQDYIDPKNPISHDRWIVFLSQVLGNIVQLDKSLVNYRQHDNNLYGKDGNAKDRESRAAFIRKAAVYLAVTRMMVNVVTGLESHSKILFPAFDRDKAFRVVRHAVFQQEARNKSYSLPPLKALTQIALSILQGAYQGAHDGKMRYRSIAKDIQIALMPRHD